MQNAIDVLTEPHLVRAQALGLATAAHVGRSAAHASMVAVHFIIESCLLAKQPVNSSLPPAAELTAWALFRPPTSRDSTDWHAGPVSTVLEVCKGGKARVREFES